MDAHRKSIIHGSGQSRWRTPFTLVEALHVPFRMSVDLAADPTSTLFADRFLGPESAVAVDALAVSWARLFPDSVGFLNPPYSLTEIKELKAVLARRIENGITAADRAIADSAIGSLRIENWARKAYAESLDGFSTIGVFPYAPQSRWFRAWVMGHDPELPQAKFHAALDFWRLPHRVSFLKPDGTPAANAGVNTCIIHWGPNPGFVGPWVPSGRYWSYR